MKTNQNAGGQPPGAGTAYAGFLRTVLKRAVMRMYCAGLITAETVARVFARFDLRSD